MPKANFRDGDTKLSPDWLNEVGRNARPPIDGPDDSPAVFSTTATVLITQAPSDGDKTLTVRRVRYADLPPKPCIGEANNQTCYYAFEGQEFSAYPDYGHIATDYSDDVWEGSSISNADTFLKAYYEFGVWLLEKPSASTEKQIELVLPREITSLATATVQLTIRDDNGQIVGRTRTNDETGEEEDVLMEVLLWPHVASVHYEEIFALMPVLRMIREHGVWYLLQDMAFDMRTPPIKRPAGECRS